MKDQCTQAKDLFRQANDVRGQVICAPNIPPSSRKSDQKKLSEKWLKKSAQHWKTCTYRSISDRCNQKEKLNLPLSSRTRQQKNKDKIQPKLPKRSKIGLWHFHPNIIEKYSTHGTTIPRAIPDDEAESLSLYSKSGGSFYSNSDTVTDNNGKHLVLFLPIYLLKDAISDAKHAKQHKRLNSEIKKTAGGKTGTAMTNTVLQSPPITSAVPARVMTNQGTKRKQGSQTEEELLAEIDRLQQRANQKLRDQLLQAKNDHSAYQKRITFLEHCIRHQKDGIDRKANGIVRNQMQDDLMAEMNVQLEMYE